ncbi:MAG: hypothetical protein QGH59_10100 [Gemmatimonadota bacterium]|nr:hypothetical protein [Gemmatimonadota bacterium]
MARPATTRAWRPLPLWARVHPAPPRPAATYCEKTASLTLHAPRAPSTHDHPTLGIPAAIG